jgi:hypothetical protein
MSIELKLQRQQAKALTCPADEILYGGAAGGGKSHLIRVAAIYYCQAIPKLQAYLFRRTYGEIKRNHMEGPTSFHELLAPLVKEGKVAITEHEIRFDNGSKIHLCHLQYAKNLTNYQGAEIHLLLMDELTHFTEAEYRYLRGRVRIGTLAVPEDKKGAVPRIISGTNPGGVGHLWVKKTFIANGPMRVVRTPRSEGSMKRVFIPARLEDNPAMLANDPGYVDRLEALGDATLVKTLREGDWDVVAGAMYGDVWRKDRHEMDAFPIPYGWKIWFGADDGYAAPASVHWMTEDPDLKTVYVVAELYRSGMLPNEWASRMRDIEQRIRIGLPENETALLGELDQTGCSGLLDLAAFSNNGQTEIPRGAQLRNLGIRVKPVDKWPGSRVHRVQNLHRLLAPNPRDPQKMPGIRFFRNCRNAIESIPALPRDKDDPEDVDTKAEDHAFDSVTYGLQRRDFALKRKRAS